MKTYRIITIFKVTDEFFEKEVKELKNDILSGKYQRDFKGYRKEGMLSLKAIFEELK